MCLMRVNVLVSFFFSSLVCRPPLREALVSCEILGVLGEVLAVHCHYTGSVLAVYWQCSGGTSTTTAAVPMLHVFFMCVNVFLLVCIYFPCFVCCRLSLSRNPLRQALISCEILGTLGEVITVYWGVYWHSTSGVSVVFYVAVRFTQLGRCFAYLMCVRVDICFSFFLHFFFVSGGFCHGDPSGRR